YLTGVGRKYELHLVASRHHLKGFIVILKGISAGSKNLVQLFFQFLQSLVPLEQAQYHFPCLKHFAPKYALDGHAFPDYRIGHVEVGQWFSGDPQQQYHSTIAYDAERVFISTRCSRHLHDYIDAISTGFKLFDCLVKRLAALTEIKTLAGTKFGTKCET